MRSKSGQFNDLINYFKLICDSNGVFLNGHATGRILLAEMGFAFYLRGHSEPLWLTFMRSTEGQKDIQYYLRAQGIDYLNQQVWVHS